MNIGKEEESQLKQQQNGLEKLCGAANTIDSGPIYPQRKEETFIDLTEYDEEVYNHDEVTDDVNSILFPGQFSIPSIEESVIEESVIKKSSIEKRKSNRLQKEIEECRQMEQTLKY